MRILTKEEVALVFDHIVADLGIKKTNIAQELPMPNDTASKNLSGASKMSAETLSMICHQFGINPNYIFGTSKVMMLSDLKEDSAQADMEFKKLYEGWKERATKAEDELREVTNKYIALLERVTKDKVDAMSKDGGDGSHARKKGGLAGSGSHG